MAWKLIPGLFVVAKNQITYSKYVLAKKLVIEISSNQHTDLLRFLLTEDSLKNKKGLELVSKSHFSKNLLIYKKFYFGILHKLAKFHYQIGFTSQVIQ